MNETENDVKSIEYRRAIEAMSFILTLPIIIVFLYFFYSEGDMIFNKHNQYKILSFGIFLALLYCLALFLMIIVSFSFCG